jgi:hypothetical protein
MDHDDEVRVPCKWSHHLDVGYGCLHMGTAAKPWLPA